MGDAHVAELGIDRQHAAPHGGGEVTWRYGGIAHPAAEQQPVVAGQAEIVEHELGVADRRAVADERLRAQRPQRFGGDDVGPHRHDAPRQPRRDRAEMHIAREQHVACPHAALRGAHQCARLRSARPGVAGFDFDHGGLLVDDRACFGRGARQPEGVIERMQVAAEIVQHTGTIALAGDDGAHLLGIERLQMGVAVFALHVLGPGVQGAGFFRRHGHAHRARRPVAIYGVLIDTPAHQVDGIERHLPGEVRALRAELPLELRRGWRPHLPVTLLEMDDYFRLNPIISRRSAWSS
ncbi:hypothetical protein GALL_475540 [mine drainage metagenome]|uniref:Uncharacterized protein n=1 Tax=mine drainage metagenome TaxID=410659 RepID=A0A1J5Q4P2_9ZZZZ